MNLREKLILLFALFGVVIVTSSCNPFFSAENDEVQAQLAASSPSAVLDLSSITTNASSLAYASGYGSLQEISGTLYLFGGASGFRPWDTGTDRIQSAPASDPTTWTDLGQQLPFRHAWAESVVHGGFVYLLGSVYTNGENIYRASVGDLTSWSLVGSFPNGDKAYLYSMYVSATTVYIFHPSDDSQSVWSASLSDLSSWTDHGDVLPIDMGAAVMHDIGDKLYLTKDNGAGENVTYEADKSDPLTWSYVGISSSGGTINTANASRAFVIGDYAYISNRNGSLTIQSAPIDDMSNWQETTYSVNVNAWGMGPTYITNDTVYLLGGLNGSYVGVGAIQTIDIINP